jgi:cytidyltransferase-like protein
MIVGAANGCFDVLHLGHVRFLKETKKLEYGIV